MPLKCYYSLILSDSEEDYSTDIPRWDCIQAKAFNGKLFSSFFPIMLSWCKKCE